VIRDDIGSRLVHLTKGEPDQVAANTFLAIVKDRKLRGGPAALREVISAFVSVRHR
jgi:hypothetical protein